MNIKASDKPAFTALELAAVKPISEAARITSLSADTLERQHKDKIVVLSPRRRGMTVRNILKIVNGE